MEVASRNPMLGGDSFSLYNESTIPDMPLELSAEIQGTEEGASDHQEGSLTIPSDHDGDVQKRLSISSSNLEISTEQIRATQARKMAERRALEKEKYDKMDLSH